MHATTSHGDALSTEIEAPLGTAAERYAEDRETRRFRRRLVWFSVLVPLWALSLVPIARESMDGRDGASAVLVYLVVGALSLGVVAVFRGVYVLRTKRQFLSPWLFLIAAVVAICAYTIQSSGEKEERLPPGTALTLEPPPA
jgi:hypothetical protein